MNTPTVAILVISTIILTVISWWVGQQAYSWLPPQASAESILIDNLFSFMVTVGTFIFLGVVIAITYAVLFKRAGKYDLSDGPPIEGNVPLEIVWTVIPLVLVIGIATYSYQIYDRISIVGPMEHIHMAREIETTPGVERIEVLSRQWAWEFHYPEQKVTSTELHLPNNKRIRLVLRSEDVIHGLYIPAFRLKQDIIPNRVIDFEFTPIREGRYRLRDSQYSGTYFAAMQTDVVVESSEAFERWLETSAKEPPRISYNQAFEEYTKQDKTAAKTIIPASPPIVNYSGSKLNY
ncbi:cytochrome c oxidase subunit II [Gloeocapsa sp. PCC 73106]|uniref:cytochrome c oxidase subunit II n=1 Tax=Gloeocapsa sp. PCC 73106 TaxID=102232 RepID=UPI0002ABBAFA|nr:cytochrome c oxidase subunit II [Gloeocapsa sp. PCC 73106]ELR97895.1 heme/copper-type cytochrome/quinol oxidase, subunit 2 [Gloeocapsa sp. PCC 73106]